MPRVGTATSATTTTLRTATRGGRRDARGRGTDADGVTLRTRARRESWRARMGTRAPRAIAQRDDAEAAAEGDANADADADASDRNWEDAIELAHEESDASGGTSSGRAAEDGSNKMAKKWTGVDVGGALATFTKRKKKEESSSKIKVTDADKVMREWGDSMSWDSSRLDGTALDGMKARTPDLFDAILGQTAIDVDELETLERQRRAKRIAKELERRRKKRERVLEQEKRKALQQARVEAKKKGSAFFSGEWEDEFDEGGDAEQQEETNFSQSFAEAVKEFAQSEAAKWMFNFFVIPSLISKVVTFTIIDPIVSQELKLAGEDRTTIELRDDQEAEILGKLTRYQQRMEFDILMGREAPLTSIQKEEKIRHEAQRLEDEEINHFIQVGGNRYGDLVFISAFLIMVVVYSDQAKVVVTGTKNAFFSLEPAQQAFILLLSSDVLVGYHSADAWQTLLRSIGGHYGVKEQEELISLFVAFVPVSVDVLFKFWVFKYLRRLAPSTQVILEDIDRH